jgi:hypothetical protein
MPADASGPGIAVSTSSRPHGKGATTPWSLAWQQQQQSLVSPATPRELRELSIRQQADMRCHDNHDRARRAEMRCGSKAMRSSC